MQMITRQAWPVYDISALPKETRFVTLPPGRYQVREIPGDGEEPLLVTEIDGKTVGAKVKFWVMLAKDNVWPEQKVAFRN